MLGRPKSLQRALYCVLSCKEEQQLFFPNVSSVEQDEELWCLVYCLGDKSWPGDQGSDHCLACLISGAQDTRVHCLGTRKKQAQNQRAGSLGSAGL